ncbi:MAG: hypothetical protein AAF438_13760 [Pseudomonadota bacterium]
MTLKALLLMTLSATLGCEGRSALRDLMINESDALYIEVRRSRTVPYCFESSTESVSCNAELQALAERVGKLSGNRIDPEEFRKPDFRAWWHKTLEEIAACQERVTQEDARRRQEKVPGWRVPSTQAFNDCDPANTSNEGL